MSCALLVFAGAEFWHQLVVLPEIEATSWWHALTLTYTTVDVAIALILLARLKLAAQQVGSQSMMVQSLSIEVVRVVVNLSEYMETSIDECQSCASPEFGILCSGQTSVKSFGYKLN
jgi:hypothetical protein